MIIRIKPKAIIATLLAVVIIQLSFLMVENFYVKSVNGDAEEKVTIPIILYHSILTKDKIIDRYTITPSELESDLEYVRDNGYTTITMSDLIDYVYDGKALPVKPLIITFDDGYLNNYEYAYPLLKKYEMKAVLSIIGCYVDLFTNEKSDNLVYSHINWDQVNALLESGCFELQNHTYSLHTKKKGRVGAKIKRGESLEHYEKILTEDIGGFQQLITEKTGYTPNTFVYPYGEVSKESILILKDMGFRASLSTYGGINYLTRDPDMLFGLKRNDRPRGVSSRTFFTGIYKK